MVSFLLSGNFNRVIILVEVVVLSLLSVMLQVAFEIKSISQLQPLAVFLICDKNNIWSINAISRKNNKSDSKLCR